MAALSHRFRTAQLACALACAALAACSSTEPPDSAGTCVAGQSERCACDDGASSYRTCGPDGLYGACVCGGSSGGAGGVGGEPLGGSAGSPIGGSAGVGGAGGRGGTSGMTGGAAGQAGMVGGSAGVTGGSGGVTGGTGETGGMTGGSGGMLGGNGGMTGGGGGSGGMTGGTSGMDGTGGGNGGPGRDPQPGELYGPCRDSGECDAGLLCVNDSSGGFPESYCTTTCDPLGGAACPRQRGDGMVVCVLGICVR